MDCQKANSRQIRMQGADYVLHVRANHQGLRVRFEDTFTLIEAEGIAGSSHYHADTVGKSYGSIEIRCFRTMGDLAHLVPNRNGCNLASLVWVESGPRGRNRATSDTASSFPACPQGQSPAVGGTEAHRKCPRHR